MEGINNMIINNQCMNCENFNKKVIVDNNCKVYIKIPNDIYFKDKKCKFFKKIKGGE